MNPQEAPKVCCNCSHHWIRPTAVVLVGVAFLLQAFGWLSVSVVSIIWPILLIVWGATKFCRCCHKK